VSRPTRAPAPQLCLLTRVVTRSSFCGDRAFVPISPALERGLGMRTSKGLLKGVVVATTIVVTVLLGTGQAYAISRVTPCNNDIYENTGALHVISNASTCWKSAGTVSVVLNNVSSFNSNNTSGYIKGKNQGAGSGAVSHTFYFNKEDVLNILAAGYQPQQITTIHIN
jgi:hypothetical protein